MGDLECLWVENDVRFVGGLLRIGGEWRVEDEEWRLGVESF